MIHHICIQREIQAIIRILLASTNVIRYQKEIVIIYFLTTHSFLHSSNHLHEKNQRQNTNVNVDVNVNVSLFIQRFDKIGEGDLYIYEKQCPPEKRRVIEGISVLSCSVLSSLVWSYREYSISVRSPMI